MEKRRKGEPNLKRAMLKNVQARKKQEVNKENDNWEIVKKNPITKVVVIVGATIGLLYLSSFLFDAAAKTATSFGNLKQAIQRKTSV